MPPVRQRGIIADSEGWRNVKDQKEIEMKALCVPRLFTGLSPLLAAGSAFTLAALIFASPVSASSDKSGDLLVNKECSQYTGLPGSFCTITSSNVAAIKIGSKVFYDQGAGVPAGMLDSNVVLDGGSGNRALGRCTVDAATGSGLCTFSDGTGTFAGFHARVNVSYLGGPNYRWAGTYSFGSDHDHDKD
jgi:hypothetical protein